MSTSIEGPAGDRNEQKTELEGNVGDYENMILSGQDVKDELKFIYVQGVLPVLEKDERDDVAYADSTE